ncbi:MAG TPA: hypothetical protein VD913_00140, partial [bacterium]|nr:hypothetical protein [bacterium]
MRKILFFLLGISFAAFGLDLFHMIFHLADAPALWQIRGVPVKFMTKLAFFLIPVIFYFNRRLWLSWLLAFLFLITASGP